MLTKRRRQDEAERTKAVANELVALDEGHCRHIERHRVALDEDRHCYADEFTERLRLMEEAGRHHVASLEATVSAAIAERRRHVAPAQTAALAELALAEARRHHDAAMQMAMSVASSLADEHHHHKELQTTTLPEPPAMLSPSPRPTSSYLGAVLNTNGGAIGRRFQRCLPWRLQHHFPSSATNHFGSATVSDLVVALDITTVLALPAL